MIYSWVRVGRCLEQQIRAVHDNHRQGLARRGSVRDEETTVQVTLAARRPDTGTVTAVTIAGGPAAARAGRSLPRRFAACHRVPGDRQPAHDSEHQDAEPSPAP
jgi:hypothetical protein